MEGYLLYITGSYLWPGLRATIPNYPILQTLSHYSTMSTQTNTTISKEVDVETPFLTGARKSGSSVSFWASYVQSRPNPTEDFFQLINEYHKR